MEKDPFFCIFQLCFWYLQRVVVVLCYSVKGLKFSHVSFWTHLQASITECFFISFSIEVFFFPIIFSANRSMVCSLCLCVWVRFKFMVQLYLIQERIIALDILAFVELSKYMCNEYNLRSLEVVFLYILSKLVESERVLSKIVPRYLYVSVVSITLLS